MNKYIFFKLFFSEELGSVWDRFWRVKKPLFYQTDDRTLIQAFLLILTS